MVYAIFDCAAVETFSSKYLFTQRSVIYNSYIMNQSQRSYIGFFLVSCMIGVIGAVDEVKLSIETTRYPSFYKDEPITMTCTASVENGLSYVYLVKGVDIDDPKTECRYNTVDHIWRANNLLDTPGFSAIDNAHCNDAAAAAPPFILSVTGAVTENIIGVTFRCFAETATARFNSTPDSISHIDVKPENLVMTAPANIIEGEAFSFSCNADEARPPSEYTYKVLRGDEEIASSSSYTPTEQDRGGIVLRCEDKTHAVLHDVYRDDVIVEKSVKVLYVDFKDGRSGTQVVDLNPLSEQTLECGVAGNGVKVTWDCNNVCVPRTGPKTSIPADSAKGGDQQMMSCTGSVEGTDLSRTESWTIEWSNAAPQPTDPAGEGKRGHGAVVGGAVGAAVLIAGIAGVAVFLLRRPNGRTERERQDGREDEKKVPQTTQEGQSRTTKV